MSKYEEEIDLIEQYLEGSLDEKQKRLIEEKLSTDKDFAENTEQHKLMIDGLKYSEREKLYAKLKKWDLDLPDELDLEGGQSQKPETHWYYAIASFILLGAVSFLIYSNYYSGYDKLVAENYTPYSYVPQVNRGGTIEDRPAENIFKYYDRDDYDQAILLFNQLEESQKTEQVYFITANAYQANKDYDKAIALYEQIIKSGEVYVPGSKWYLALCYLSVNKASKAALLLEELQGSTTSYSPKAQHLLESL